MTIRPGQPWGRPSGGEAPAAVAGSDAELATLAAAGPAGPLAVTAGDLHRAVGGPRAGAWAHAVPVDVLLVELDGRPPVVVVAHVLARRSWWHGPVVAICNVDYIGAWNVAPRAHPNDGRADVVELDAAMGTRARWQAWRRAPHGTHVPHPSISTRSARRASFEYERPLRVWLDGVPAGSARTITVDVRPDAFELLI